MVSQFIATLRLPEKIQEIYRRIGVGVDIAYWSTKLPEDVLQELANLIETYDLTSSDIRKLVDYKRRTNKPIKQCVDEILKWRPKPREIVVIELKPEAMDKLIALSREFEIRPESLLVRLLETKLGLKVISSSITKFGCTLVMSKGNYSKLLKLSSQEGLKVEDLISTIILKG